MKAHKRDAVLEILVHTDPAGIVELAGELGTVKMIPFSGTVSGPYFQGAIEPCGVDTQITNACEVRHMSARYMLSGTDHTGCACHIYVENNGWFTDGAHPRPWTSVPTFLTDSSALAPLLHKSSFVGEGQREEDGLHIRFYEIEQTEK